MLSGEKVMHEGATRRDTRKNAECNGGQTEENQKHMDECIIGKEE